MDLGAVRGQNIIKIFPLKCSNNKNIRGGNMKEEWLTPKAFGKSHMETCYHYRSFLMYTHNKQKLKQRDTGPTRHYRLAK